MTDEIDPSELADRILDAIDAEPGDEIQVVTPQFERRDGVDPAESPLTPAAFDRLKELPEDELRDLGLRAWSEDSDLWLFPASWYPHIPVGYEVVDIFGDVEEFDPEKHSDDRRMGVLSYGIVTEGGDPPKSEERLIERDRE